jgi:hypothetical protein
MPVAISSPTSASRPTSPPARRAAVRPTGRAPSCARRRSAKSHSSTADSAAPSTCVRAPPNAPEARRPCAPRQPNTRSPPAFGDFHPLHGPHAFRRRAGTGALAGDDGPGAPSHLAAFRGHRPAGEVACGGGDGRAAAGGARRGCADRHHRRTSQRVEFASDPIGAAELGSLLRQATAPPLALARAVRASVLAVRVDCVPE